ncbi:unnamed protein product [Chrysoparadoxa australica]
MASSAANNEARCKAADMYLKGEGGPANYTRAAELYTAAAEENHVRALNGLGFEYFFGHNFEQNLPKAFGYFKKAAAIGTDGDSLFNYGQCLSTGAGTAKDVTKAAEVFSKGAELGHFDSTYELAISYREGKGVPYDPDKAASQLLSAAKMGGRWGGLVRHGFDCYINGSYVCALLAYTEAAEMGYSVAATNAAFLLDRKRVALPLSEADTKAMSLRYHLLGTASSYVPAYNAIGDAYFEGSPPYSFDPEQALFWYSMASSGGSVRGVYNVAYMLEHGLGIEQDLDAARAYYHTIWGSKELAATREKLALWTMAGLGLVSVTIKQLWRRGKRIWSWDREAWGSGLEEDALLMACCASLSLVCIALANARRKRFRRSIH